MDRIKIQDFVAWDKAMGKRRPLSFDLELTARCNNNCRHCYINLPVDDRQAIEQELSAEEIFRIADEALSMGTVWCLVTGGEPLLRDDFEEIYIGLKKRGFLISIFTNATALKASHIELFQRYPPRDIEVSVYGVTKKTYERVSRVKGSFEAFEKGVTMLVNAGLNLRFKAMALRSTYDEMEKISAWCRERTKDYYRYDYQLHGRFDGDEHRNQEIKDERLSPEEIVALERADPERSAAMQEQSDTLILTEKVAWQECTGCSRKDGCEQFEEFSKILHCGAGNGSFSVSYNGIFRLCSSLWHPDMTYDLRNGLLKEAWEVVVPEVRNIRSSSKEFFNTCKSCPIINLCMWCAAHAHLENGNHETRVSWFCEVAKARAAELTGDPRWLTCEPWEMELPQQRALHDAIEPSATDRHE